MEELKPYKAQEVADVLRVNVRVVYKLISTGKLKAIRVGRDWRVTRAALELYLAGGPRTKGPDDTLEMIEVVA